MYPDEVFLEPTPDPNEITLSDLVIEEDGHATKQQPSTDRQSDDTDGSGETADKSHSAENATDATVDTVPPL